MLTKSNGVSHSVPAGENAFDSHLCYAAPPVHTPDGERLYYMGSNGATTVCFVYFPDDRDEFTKTGLGRNILVGKALKKEHNRLRMQARTLAQNLRATPGT
jgi:hypothetical protein